MEEKITDKQLDFLLVNYDAIREWIHKNDKEREGLPDSNYMEFTFGYDVDQEYQDFLYQNFPRIRDWVHKNDQLCEELSTGNYHPRLMQVPYDDFLMLEEWW